MIFPGEAWRRVIYPCSVLVYYYQIHAFIIFPAVFLPSEVKPRSRTLFPQLVLTLFWNLHPGCDLAECCLYPSWFCLVIPSAVCLFFQHIHDNIHTLIHTSCVVELKIMVHFHSLMFLLAYYPLCKVMLSSLQ